MANFLINCGRRNVLLPPLPPKNSFGKSISGQMVNRNKWKPTISNCINNWTKTMKCSAIGEKFPLSAPLSNAAKITKTRKCLMDRLSLIEITADMAHTHTQVFPPYQQGAALDAYSVSSPLLKGAHNKKNSPSFVMKLGRRTHQG